MKKLSPKNRWWLGSEKEWVYQDNLGDWWIFNKRSNKTQNKKNIPLGSLTKKTSEKSFLLSWDNVLGMIYALVLASSISLNVYQYLMIKMLSK